jgi:hypothetical protein
MKSIRSLRSDLQVKPHSSSQASSSRKEVIHMMALTLLPNILPVSLPHTEAQMTENVQLSGSLSYCPLRPEVPEVLP